MHRGHHLAPRLLLTAVASLGLFGCGGPEAREGMQIHFQSQALLADAQLVAIYFYEPERVCAELRTTQPRPPSILGPYQAALDDAGRRAGISFKLNEVPVGEYVVFVDALDGHGRNVGTGCAPGQQVFDRQLSGIRVVISENP